jgi:hypothetical protein
VEKVQQKFRNATVEALYSFDFHFNIIINIITTTTQKNITCFSEELNVKSSTVTNKKQMQKMLLCMIEILWKTQEAGRSSADGSLIQQR